MKIYSASSTLTIRQRIEKLSKYDRKTDPYISIYDDTDGDGFLFGFYLSEWNSPYDDFKSRKALDYRLDVETKSPKYINLGFDGFSPYKWRASS